MFVAGLDLGFNLIMLGVTLGLLYLWRCQPRLWLLPAIVACQGLIGLALGSHIARDLFELMRFGTHVVFLHWTLFAVALGWSEQRTSPRIAWVSLGCAFILIAIAIQSFVLEPYQLELHRLRIESPKLQRPLKIVFLTDPQIDEVGETEKEPWLLTMKEKPDLIILGGDYVQEVDEPRRYRVRARLNGFLHRIGLTAPLGILAVNGNLDHGRWGECFASLPVRLFSTTAHVDLPGLRVTGLGFRQSLEPGAHVAATSAYHIVVGHSPNFALGAVEADLLLAGHTHGGQVRIPGYGPLIVNCLLPNEMSTGQTLFPDGRRLLVSRGTGLERGFAPRMRFLCPPEMHVIELVPVSTSVTAPAMAD